ncbi:MAG: hypothetical protein LUD81_02785 [Clostridiales bacterium]|nr:hypothetical protein [Clostridiales bacterium]
MTSCRPTRDSNSSSDSVTVRGEATSGLTIKEAPEETNSSDSGETAAEE